MRLGIEFFPYSLRRPWEADAYWLYVIQDLIPLFHQTEIICLTSPQVAQLPAASMHRHMPVGLYRWTFPRVRRWWKKQRPDLIFSVHRPAQAGRQIPCCVYVSPADGNEDQQLAFSQQWLQRLWDQLHTRNHLVIFPFQPEGTWASALRTTVLYPVPEAVFHPRSWEEEQRCRMQLTEGHPYFLSAAVPVHDMKKVVTWLKAFSVLKKRLQSAVRWVWVLEPRHFSQAERLLKGYRFRKDVILQDVEDLEVLAGMLSSAYAYLAVGSVSAQWRMMLASVYCGVPVMGIGHPVYQALMASAGMWLSYEDTEIIAAQWLRLYQDEYLRKQMVQTCQHQRAFAYETFLHTLQSQVLSCISLHSPKS
ncbi:hypothetical protein BXY57_0509 [Thermoflavifilum aggregans]|uniref:Glycosyltransferase involved in cell wall biosynthesis n=1 Tax=Thermoflavifilum aggregans TaxID=454188 RepID=A0A2M9CSS4_9BACT|nr:glycosyltransferase [Thermoflavifilum aggregans]PJJ74943.1 hypothetical protein BXY57_0509 [Thermoflavifilum aggregans]